jgi:hypothetical protein
MRQNHHDLHLLRYDLKVTYIKNNIKFAIKWSIGLIDILLLTLNKDWYKLKNKELFLT